MTVVNVGAGTGSYEPADRRLVAIEPSPVMIAQRPPDAAPAIIATAEALPLADDSVDAAMAVLTDHHWSDRARGLAEMRRVARRRAVVFQHDPSVAGAFWLARDYLPTFLHRLRRQGARRDDGRRSATTSSSARSRPARLRGRLPRRVLAPAATPTSTRRSATASRCSALLPEDEVASGGRAAAGGPRQRRLGAALRRRPRARRARPRLPGRRRRVRGMTALIFDLDGTLVDTVYAHVFAWQRALAERGMAIDGWRIHRRIGMSGGLFTRAVGARARPRARRDEAHALQDRHGELFREMLPERRPLPGAVDLLAALRAGGVVHGIATSGRRPEIDASLAVLDVPDDDGRRPARRRRAGQARAGPLPRVRAAARRRRRTHCFVVGDAVWDLLAARRAGMLSIGLLSGGYGDDELTRAGAFRVYRDAAELHAALDELGIEA